MNEPLETLKATIRNNPEKPVVDLFESYIQAIVQATHVVPKRSDAKRNFNKFLKTV